MVEVKSDVAKNCLFITLKGFMRFEEVKEAADKTITEAGKLSPGFTIINDISEFKPASAEAGEHIKRTQAEVFNKGVKRVIRIVGRSTIGEMQFARTQKEAGAGYETIRVETMEEALKLL